MTRGFQLAVLALCFVMASAALAATGVYGLWGVSVDTGQDDPSQNLSEDEDLVDPTLDSNDGVVDSVVDTVTPGLGVIQTLTDAVRGTQSILTALGLPAALARPIAGVALIAVALSVAKFIRGV
jgi:hypothetical protein